MARFNEMQIMSSGTVFGPSANDYAQTVFSMNAASASFGAFFMAQEDVTITHLGISYIDRSGTPPQQRISLREPTSDGLVGSTVLASKTFTPPADSSWDGTFQWLELVNPYPAQRGEKLVLYLEYISGAVSNSNRSRYFAAIRTSRVFGHYPYYITNNGASVRSGDAPIFGYKSSTRSYGRPLKSISTQTINSPGQAGLRFLLDRGFGSTFKLLGASFVGRLAGSAGQTLDLVLYNAAGDELNRVTRDCDQFLTPINDDTVRSIYFDDAILESLEFGQEYFLVLEPGGASTSTQIRTFDLQEEDDMTALRGGSALYLVTRASDAVDFTRDRTRRPIFDELFIEAWSA